MAVLFTHQTPMYARNDLPPVFLQERFDAGDLIPDVTIYTDDLPAGTPTDPFHPYLDRGKGRYAITVDIDIDTNGLRLQTLNWGKTNAPIGEYTLKNGAFHKGLPVTIMRGDHAYPGILTPVR